LAIPAEATDKSTLESLANITDEVSSKIFFLLIESSILLISYQQIEISSSSEEDPQHIPDLKGTSTMLLIQLLQFK
jgi:hypothetical protein